MRRLLILTVASLTSVTCFAHKDTLIRLQADGRLEGLPAEYSPAALRLAFSKNRELGGPVISSLELKIGSKTVTVPLCVTGLILTESLKDVLVSASWYHGNSPSMLPPHLNVTLYDPGNEDAKYRGGYTLLFNLSTAKLIEMDVVIPRGADSAQYIPVDFREECFREDLQTFSERRLRPNTSLERTRGR